MNVQLIQMERTKAIEILDQYKQVAHKNRDAEYQALRQGYKALAKGLSLIDVGEAIKHAGLDHLKRPRMAICRPDAQYVFWSTDSDLGGYFSMDRRINGRATRRFIKMPPGTFADRDAKRWDKWKAIVPSIPPPLRPPHALSNYHILWEAEWQAVPRDPILLRRLSGLLFVVLAQWDMSPLEQAILRGKLQVN